MSCESSQARQAKHTASPLQRTTTTTTSVCATRGSGPLCVIVAAWNTKRHAFSKRRPESEEAVEAEDQRSRRNRVARSMPLYDLVSRWECAPTGLRCFFQLPKSCLILFQKPLGETRFAFPRRSLAVPEREAIESVPVAQALREESTHGRPRALREEFVMSTQVSSHHLVKQGLRAATLHTPH